MPGSTLGTSHTDGLSTEFGNQKQYDIYMGGLKNENDAKVEKLVKDILKSERAK